MKTGLVLEGGAMRGMFTAGALDVLMEQGVAFDGVMGVSAGAALGCNYKSRQIGRSLRYNQRFCRDWRYCSFRSLLLTGDLYGADFAYRRVPEELDPFDTVTYQSHPSRFWVVCTNAATGAPVYHECPRGDREDIAWIRASASMPGVSRMVWLDGMPLSDGGTSDSIPLLQMQAMGFDRCVVILTQPAGYVKQPNQLLPLLRLPLRRYPALVEALRTRHLHYNDTLREIACQEAEGRILVLRPEAPLNIGAVCHDPEEMARVYRLGQEQMTRHLDAVKAFLRPAQEAQRLS